MRWLPGEIINDTHRLLAPASLSPGRYRLFVGLYDPDTGQRLLVVDTDAQPVDSRVLVVTFEASTAASSAE